MQDDLLHPGAAPRRLLKKSEYARHRGCSASLISKLIRLGKLTEPSLTAEGLVDVELADRQIAAQAQVVRVRAQNPGEEASGGLGGEKGAPTDLVALAASKREAAALDVERKRFALARDRGEYLEREVAERALQDFVAVAIAALDHTRPERAQRLVGLTALDQALAAVERQDAAYRAAVTAAAQKVRDGMARLA